MNEIGFGIRAAWIGGLAMVVQLAWAGPLDGTWGGDQVRFVVDANGGRLESGCATGTVAGPLKPGADGRFSAGGTFESHGGGPQRADTAEARRAARYTGEVQGDVMTLTVRTDAASAPQVFELRRGVQVKLVRCL